MERIIDNLKSLAKKLTDKKRITDKTFKSTENFIVKITEFIQKIKKSLEDCCEKLKKTKMQLEMLNRNTSGSDDSLNNLKNELNKKDQQIEKAEKQINELKDKLENELKNKNNLDQNNINIILNQITELDKLVNTIAEGTEKIDEDLEKDFDYTDCDDKKKSSKTADFGIFDNLFGSSSDSSSNNTKSEADDVLQDKPMRVMPANPAALGLRNFEEKTFRDIPDKNVGEFSKVLENNPESPKDILNKIQENKKLPPSGGKRTKKNKFYSKLNSNIAGGKRHMHPITKMEKTHYLNGYYGIAGKRTKKRIKKNKTTRKTKKKSKKSKKYIKNGKKNRKTNKH